MLLKQMLCWVMLAVDAVLSERVSTKISPNPSTFRVYTGVAASLCGVCIEKTAKFPCLAPTWAHKNNTARTRAKQADNTLT
jgi:hypothetical protein